MKIYTGNFANLKKYLVAGLYPISIARFNRYFNGSNIIELAPHSWLINYPEEKYIPEYQKILKGLVKEQVILKIKQITSGRDAILLCYEKAGDFCHRQLVAKWLSDIQEVKEFETVKQKEPTLF
jgi:hypothetical protein